MYTKQHNYKVPRKKNYNKNSKCNCRSKPKCPLNGKCPTGPLECKTRFTTSNNIFVYYGSSEGEFKTRYKNHT